MLYNECVVCRTRCVVQCSECVAGAALAAMLQFFQALLATKSPGLGYKELLLVGLTVTCPV